MEVKFKETTKDVKMVFFGKQGMEEGKWVTLIFIILSYSKLTLKTTWMYCFDENLN